MTNKLTPQEAWEHFTTMNPKVSGLERRGDQSCIVRIGLAGYQWVEFVDIDWPEGVDQWPPKEPEPIYETPLLPDDGGKECEFAQVTDRWKKGILDGFKESAIPFCWSDTQGCTWMRCRIRRVPAQAETPPSTEHKEVNCTEQDRYISASDCSDECVAMPKGLQSTLKPVPIEIEQHPADREPTDEELTRVCTIHDGFLSAHGMAHVRAVLKAWQQVWREAGSPGGSEQASIHEQLEQSGLKKTDGRFISETLNRNHEQFVQYAKEVVSGWEPTDEELARAWHLVGPIADESDQCAGIHWLKAWQRVWRESQ